MASFIRELADPGNIYAHLSYVLLISSMMMTSLRRLRILALGSGVAAMLHFTLQTRDNASLVWEALFVTANAAQLAILLYRSRLQDLRPEEHDLLDHVLRLHDPAARLRVLALLAWRDAEIGEALIAQGQSAPPLIYIASGAAAIMHDGKQVGVCGQGDFLGEMSLVSGGKASASVMVANRMQIAVIDRTGLEQLARQSPEIGNAFDSALNRGLAAKVLRMNQAASAGVADVSGDRTIPDLAS